MRGRNSVNSHKTLLAETNIDKKLNTQTFKRITASEKRKWGEIPILDVLEFKYCTCKRQCHNLLFKVILENCKRIFQICY